MTNRKMSSEKIQTIGMRKQAKRELREREAEKHPCYDLFDYSRGIRLNAMHLQEHINSGSCKRREAAKAALLSDFTEADANFLQINNPEGWLRFYPIFAAVLNTFAESNDCFFLTLAPAQYCMSFKDAKIFDFKKKLLAWVREMLRGLDYVGFVDIACYSNWAGSGKTGRTLSFHVHVVVRGASRRTLDAYAKRINLTHSAFVPGCKAAHVEPVEPGTLRRLAAYMCKGPTGDYHVWSHTVPDVDKNGRPFKRAFSGHRQWKKQFASPGLQLDVRDVVRHIHLDDLLFAGGSGKDSMAVILRHARSGMPHSMRRHRETLHSGKLPDRPLYTSDTGWLSDFTYDVKKDPDRRSLKRPWKFDPLAQIIERMAR